MFAQQLYIRETNQLTDAEYCNRGSRKNTDDASIAEMQYPHTPNRTVAFALTLVDPKLSVIFALSLKRSIDFRNGTDSVTSNRRRNAANRNRGVMAAIGMTSILFLVDLEVEVVYTRRGRNTRKGRARSG